MQHLKKVLAETSPGSASRPEFEGELVALEQGASDNVINGSQEVVRKIGEA